MYLLTPDDYFDDKVGLPLLPAFLSLFFYGGAALLSSIISAIVITDLETTQSPSLISDLTPTFVYLFISAVILTGVITIVFYSIVVVFGSSRMDLITTFEITGLGFIPISTVSVIELFFVIYYFFTNPVVQSDNITHPVLSGTYGLLPAVLLFLLYVLSVSWACYVWSSAINQLGNISPPNAIKIMIGTGIGLILYFILIAVV